VITVRKTPCPSCPYRRDVPSGVWDASEYDKLPGYDGDIPEQLAAGALALFHCHQRTGELCAGWAGCHDMENNLAMRMHGRDVDPAAHEYVSPVPLFGSGAEAAEHGKRHLAEPDDAARVKIAQLIRLQSRLRSRNPVDQESEGHGTT
jgi:hypothetical protein